MSRARPSESGASLVLVLVLVLVFGLLVPVLGQLGSASNVATHVVKGQRFDEQSAASSVQAAIAWARTTDAAGRDNVACPDLTTKFPRDDGYGRTVTVHCRAIPGSGRLQEGPNTPTYALQTTGTGSDEIGIDVTGAGPFSTVGPAWSNSGGQDGDPAIFTSANLDDHADLVGGVGPCSTPSGQVFGAPDLCNSGVAIPDPGGTGDPTGGKWASSVQSIDDVPLRSVPDDPCPTIPASRVYALQPGYYHDGPGLEALTNRNAPNFCGDTVLWLEPGPGNTVGRFYFDLSFFDPSFDATWPMNAGAIVGGAPSGWAPDAATSQVDAVRGLIGGEGSCNKARNGVELVFGDRTRIRLREPAELELCPVARGATEVGQAISIYGRKTGDAPRTTVSTAPSAVASGGWFSWPPGLPAVDPLRIPDCDGAAPCASGSSMAGTLSGRQVAGTITMAVPYQVETGVRLDAFTIAVRHRESEATTGDLAALTLTLGGLPAGYTCDVSAVQPSIGAWRTDNATCTASDAPTNGAPSTDFTATLTATNANRDGALSGVELDSLKADATFTRPALRAQAGCIVVPEGRDGCTPDQSHFLDLSARGKASVSIWGTVYAPRARVYADFQDQSPIRFARGAVVRSFAGVGLPSVPGLAAFSLPNRSSYADRYVSFEAFVDGRSLPTLEARVYFCESLTPDGDRGDRCLQQPPAAPRITTWQVGR